jgi:hypothetical protein
MEGNRLKTYEVRSIKTLDKSFPRLCCDNTSTIFIFSTEGFIAGAMEVIAFSFRIGSSKVASMPLNRWSRADTCLEKSN